MPSAWLSPLPPAVIAVETTMPVCVGVVCVAVMVGSWGGGFGVIATVPSGRPRVNLNSPLNFVSGTPED